MDDRRLHLEMAEDVPLDIWMRGLAQDFPAEFALAGDDVSITVVQMRRHHIQSRQQPHFLSSLAPH